MAFCFSRRRSIHTSIMAPLPTVRGGRLNKPVKARLGGTRGCQWNHKQGNHFREPEGKRKAERETERQHAEPVSGFRSQAIFSEWRRMPNMSHRAPTLNSAKENLSEILFLLAVCDRQGPQELFVCATVHILYTHTHTHTGKKSLSMPDTPHM